MDSYNSSANFSLGADDSQLLDVMEVLPSDSSTSRPDDLSLADLSLDQTVRLGLPAPFSLLSRPQEAPSRQREEQQQQEQRQKGKATASSKLIDPENDPDATRRWEGGGDEAQRPPRSRRRGRRGGLSEEARRRTEKIREDKLQSDIFILKKLNAAFEQFNGALDEAGAANHRVAEQLVETDMLLNKYVRILSKSEDFARLVFDEEWHGAEADEEELRLGQLAAEHREREAARERELAEQRERERREKAERDRAAREEKDRVEQAKKDRLASRGGVRGVRGTRASMRGMRGSALSSRPESSTSTRSRPSVAPGSTGIPVKRGTTVGTSSRGASTRRV
ncbi:hypothetical protein FA13DRAFT_1752359 [Coprinellus micaceus]|uniref:DASH complex subunit DUO1 n=1 Tax=Coprinellus micaceus TaxID=71717 RepID=A0A4Y7TUT3_COPMI|nr:hypothetical protein FA13DRAFT_1752359 [Coprinellus micaceus]